jgi:D-beta-D-heptose 7-phosphate kinase/D-beta-D-heptose 1-phosphate adenosyltransferase
LKDKVDLSLMQTVHDRPTIRKTRVTSSIHQLVRIDWETAQPIANSVQDKILHELNKIQFDAMLVSDYGKGVLTPRILKELLKLAKSRGVPSVVDPKDRDFSRYREATLITPNRKEACEALEIEPSNEVSGEVLGRELQKKYELQNVLVTLGPKGMVMIPVKQSDSPIQMPALAREVYDVSGAGDTVAAMMTLGFASKASSEHSMRIATTAAALVVQKRGTQPVGLVELEVALKAKDSLIKGPFTTHDKIVSREALSFVLKTPASRNDKVVFTNGCFDLIHAGHVDYLEKARTLGDVLVVGVNDDESVCRLKGRERPFVSIENRMKMLAGLSCVDYVVCFAEDTPYELIKVVLPDVLVKGADWAKDDIVGADLVKNSGGVVDTIEYLPGLSTTALVAKIRGES